MTAERIAEKIIDWFDGEWPPLRRLRIPRSDQEMFRAIWDALKEEGLVRTDSTAVGLTRTKHYSSARVMAVAIRVAQSKVGP